MVTGAWALAGLGIFAGISGTGSLLCCVVGIYTVSSGECEPFVQLYCISEAVSSWQAKMNMVHYVFFTSGGVL